jgi:hypothetical protein
MSNLVPGSGRRTTEALLCIGAAVLAGLLLRGAPRVGPTRQNDPDDTLAFDDPGIPLRLAALTTVGPHTLR